jgi:hypothetical protein
MNAILETLMLRRPVINYVSPAACEIILSGSGVGAFIVLTPFSRIHKVGGLRLTETSPGSFTLNWDTTPGGDPPLNTELKITTRHCLISPIAVYRGRTVLTARLHPTRTAPTPSSGPVVFQQR